MIKTFTVGEDIAAWCTKCKLELEHTITVIIENLPKKVKCNTCGGEHNYRTQPVQRSSSSTTTARKKRTKKTGYEEQMALLEQCDPSQAKKYMISGSFEVNDIIGHTKFGTGIVTAIIKTNKIEVLFKDGIKVLIQNHS